MNFVFLVLCLLPGGLYGLDCSEFSIGTDLTTAYFLILIVAQSFLFDKTYNEQFYGF